MATHSQYSCLENPVDKVVWWAAVYGVAQSRTRLKRLSSSSRSRRLQIFRKSSSFLPYNKDQGNSLRVSGFMVTSYEREHQWNSIYHTL